MIGGTGKLGYGLAKRFAAKGKQVVIGSRNEIKAKQKAKEINVELFAQRVEGRTIHDAAKMGDIVFVTVPYKAQRETIEQIKKNVSGKIVVDTTVPLNPKNVTSQVNLPISSAESASEILGKEDVHLVAGFHTISHTVLENLEKSIDSDVLLCGNDDHSVEVVSSLVEELGARPIHAGGLEQARVLERLTPMIIGMNKRYKKRHIGITMTGLE